MNNQSTQLKTAIMQRVRVIHYMRTTVRPLLIEIGIGGIALVALFFTVSVPSIIQNLQTLPSISAGLWYLIRAFLETEFLVQSLLLVVTISACVVVVQLITRMRDTTRIIRIG